MIYAGGGSVIEAGDIVEANNIQRKLLAAEDDACVLRLSDLNSDEVVNKAVSYARLNVGMEYSIKEALRVTEKAKVAIEPNRQICSRLIAQSYQYAGVQLVENIDYCTVGELEKSNKLERIGGIIREATDRDLQIAESPHLLNDQSQIIESLLCEIRTILGRDIQSMHQLTVEIYSQPEKISDVMNVINKSGYLDLWKREMELNNHLYDEKAFKSYFKGDSVVAAIEVLETNRLVTERYKSVYMAFREIQMLNGSNKYIESMIDLYCELLRMCEIRHEVALKILNNQKR